MGDGLVRLTPAGPCALSLRRFIEFLREKQYAVYIMVKASFQNIQGCTQTSQSQRWVYVGWSWEGNFGEANKANIFRRWLGMLQVRYFTLVSLIGAAAPFGMSIVGMTARSEIRTLAKIAED